MVVVIASNASLSPVSLLCFIYYFLSILLYIRRRRPAIIRDAGPLHPSSIGLCWLQHLSTGNDEGAHGPLSLWQFGTSEQTCRFIYLFTLLVDGFNFYLRLAGTVSASCYCCIHHRSSMMRSSGLGTHPFCAWLLHGTTDSNSNLDNQRKWHICRPFYYTLLSY